MSFNKLTKYKNTPACTVNEGHLLAARLQGLLPGPAPTPRSRLSRGSLTSSRSPAMGTRPPSRHTRRRRTPRRLERRQRAPRAPPPPPPRPLRAAPALVGGGQWARTRRSRTTTTAARRPHPPPLPSLPFDQPHGRLSAAARVLVAMSAARGAGGGEAQGGRRQRRVPRGAGPPQRRARQLHGRTRREDVCVAFLFFPHSTSDCKRVRRCT